MFPCSRQALQAHNRQSGMAVTPRIGRNVTSQKLFKLWIIVSIPLLRSEAHKLIPEPSAGQGNSSVSCVKTHCSIIKSHKKYSYYKVLKTTALFCLILRIIGGKKSDSFFLALQVPSPTSASWENKRRGRKTENNTFSSFFSFSFPFTIQCTDGKHYCFLRMKTEVLKFHTKS